VSDVGLNAAVSGILADQAELDTTAENLSNAQTQGYAAERVSLDALSPASPNGVGQGVLIGAVTQKTSPLYEQLNLIAQGALGAANETAAVATAAQQAFPEPSSSGLQSQLSQLWTDLSALASSPANGAASTSVIEDLSGVATTLNSMYSTLTTTANQLGLELTGSGAGSGLLGQANRLISEVAQLNVGIVAGNSGGLDTNALQDKQRNALAELAGLIGIRTTTESSGAVDVYAASISLVQGSTATSLALNGSVAASNLSLETANGVSVSAGGQIGALLNGITTTIPSYLGQLSDIADSLASSFNTLQAGGVSTNGTPGPASPAASGWLGPTLPSVFVNNGSPSTYTPGATAAATIALNPSLLAAPSLLATAGGNATAGISTIDPATIQQMAALGQQAGGPNDLYQSLIGTVGTKAQAAQSDQTNAKSVASSTAADLANAEGVNSDQETINMLSAQRDYQAMAQVINAMNQSLQALLQAV
jgi:flagellar hook-associated protein 1 FlgK